MVNFSDIFDIEQDVSGNVTAITLKADGAPVFKWYKAGSGWRFGSADGINTARPKFEHFGDQAYPRTRATQYIVGPASGDVTEVTIKAEGGSPAVPAPWEQVGQRISCFYVENSGKFLDGSAKWTLEHKTVAPILLSGGPAFTGYHKAGLVSGFRYPLRFNQASGASPSLNISGAAYPIKLSDGSTPAADHWGAGVEIIVAFNGSDFRADAGSDASTGVAQDYRSHNPFHGRSLAITGHMCSYPTGSNRESMWVLRAAPKWEAVERDRVGVSSSGSLVPFGKSTYEAGTNALGVRYDLAYPGQLTLSGSECTDPPESDRIRSVSPGPVNPIEWTGGANIDIPAVDASLAGAIAIRKADEKDKGLRLSYSYATNEILIEAIEPGATALTITSVANNGIGNIRLGLASHGAQTGDVARVTGSDGFDKTYFVHRVSADLIDLDGTEHDGPYTVQGTVKVAAKVVRGKFGVLNGNLRWQSRFIMDGQPLRLYSRTAAQLASVDASDADLVYCTNGDGGNPCLAVRSGGAWRRVVLGSII
jgi:hypothetical protein